MSCLLARMLIFAALFWCGLGTGSAGAVTLTVMPSADVVNLGSQVDVLLGVEGLSDFSTPALAVFDLELTFDESLFSPVAVEFGDPVIGDRLDVLGLGTDSEWTVVGGTVSLFELSFDSTEDLDDLQEGGFSIAVVTFDAIGIGTSQFDVTVYAFGDGDGEPIETIVDAGMMQVVPEPSAWLCLVVAALAVGHGRRRTPVATQDWPVKA